MGEKVVGYIRVSTGKQERSGLGLAAQRASIDALVASKSMNLLQTYTETQTARKDDLKNRPALLKAIQHARGANATLIIAKLDRLARSVFALAELKRSGIRFVICDNPYANELTIDLLMAVAANESRMISVRTREAMAQAKRNGQRFGTPSNLTEEARRKGPAAATLARAEKVADAYVHVMPLVLAMRGEGLSMQQVADRLNEASFVTRRGPWNAMQVCRVLKRAA